MSKKNSGILALIILIVFWGVANPIEGSEDYGYILGLWEVNLDQPGPQLKITVTEVFPSKSTAKIFCESSAFIDRPASSFEINDAVFRAGDIPQITFKSPVTGGENYLNFKQDGTGTMKFLGAGGRAFFGDLKKKGK